MQIFFSKQFQIVTTVLIIKKKFKEHFSVFFLKEKKD